MGNITPPWALGSMDFDSRPLFVCWEVTKACKLSCKHCRAKAIRRALPGELNYKQGIALIDQITEFGTPYPALLFTGGDALMRPDLLDLIAYARDLRIYTAVAASVTDLLNEEMISELKNLGVGVVSISLDGSDPRTHDALRGVPGTWKRSLEVLEIAKKIGLRMQINTTVMKSNLTQLSDIFDIALRYGAVAWEVFFLVRTGRGALLENPTPGQIEAVMNFLAIAAGYGLPVRTSEGPQFRRIIKQHAAGNSSNGILGEFLRKRLEELHGEPKHEVQTRSTATGDGKGVLLVAFDGEINPSGFLPINRGKFPDKSIVDVYRNDFMFRDLRDSSKLKGKCSKCGFRNICGGSRSRAYAELGDPLESDPMCTYEPA